MSTNLASLRREIDEVDDQIIDLICRRAKLAEGVADHKNAASPPAPYTDEAREREVIDRLTARSTHLLATGAIEDIVKRLIALSKLVRRMREVMTCPYHQVGIIGDGLIGRSIALALQAKQSQDPGAPTVTIHGREWRSVDYRHCDLIIISTPIESVISVAHTLATSGALSPDCTIIDVASVKSDIAKQFDIWNLEFGNLSFVSTHPMGGRPESGSAHALSTLCTDKPWIVCKPEVKNETLITKNVDNFIRYCGGIPVHLDARVHDHMAAVVSHMPGLLSRALAQYVESREPDSLQIAGSAYNLMTKVGRTTNIRMRTQIASTNEREIGRVLADFVQYLSSVDTHTW